jgi:hypothetical protein
VGRLKRGRKDFDFNEDGDKIFKNLWDNSSFRATIERIQVIGFSNPFERELHFQLENVFLSPKSNLKDDQEKNGSTTKKEDPADHERDEGHGKFDIYLPQKSNKCQYMNTSNQKDGGIENLTPLLANESSFKIYESPIETSDLTFWSGLRYKDHFSNRYILEIKNTDVQLVPLSKSTEINSTNGVSEGGETYELFHKEGVIFTTFLKDKNLDRILAPSDVRLQILQKYGDQIVVLQKRTGDSIHRKLEELLEKIERCSGDCDKARISYVCNATTDSSFVEEIKTTYHKILSVPKSNENEDVESQGNKVKVDYIPSPLSVVSMTILVSFILSRKKSTTYSSFRDVYMDGFGILPDINEKNNKEESKEENQLSIDSKEVDDLIL